ncbi:cyclic nucleotide-binding domain-containing protein [Spirillospora sp. CA-253888]
MKDDQGRDETDLPRLAALDDEAGGGEAAERRLWRLRRAADRAADSPAEAARLDAIAAEVEADRPDLLAAPETAGTAAMRPALLYEDIVSELHRFTETPSPPVRHGNLAVLLDGPDYRRTADSVPRRALPDEGTRRPPTLPRRTTETPGAGPTAGVPAERTRPLTFWEALTREEQDAFTLAAEEVEMPAGRVLWHEDEVADHLLVIMAGWAKVCVERDGREQVIAVRGAGDVLGERAALMLRRRSASVVALEALRYLRMPTQRFAAFLSTHPRVLAVLENQIYDRLTAGPAPQEPAPTRASPVRAPGRPTWAGRMCTILFTDIVGFGASHWSDDDRLNVRRAMYDLLRRAMEDSGVPWDALHREDRGDGALLVLPPDAPTGTAVDPMLARLAEGLRRHNREAAGSQRFRIRVALHVGPVVLDDHGVSGWSIIQAARLLDAPAFREALARTRADLGFITSDFVYETVVMALRQGPDPSRFQHVAHRVKESRVSGWMHLSEGA